VTGIDPETFAEAYAQLSLELATRLRERLLSKIQDWRAGIVDYICASGFNVNTDMENLDRYIRLVAHPYFRLSFE